MFKLDKGNPLSFPITMCLSANDKKSDSKNRV